jgi:hypothetical protein
METEKTTFEGWAIVEIMGHNTIAGYISEVAMFGTAMMRVDVPACGDQAAYTKFYGGSSIYGVTPTTQEIATKAAERLRIRPVSEWLVPTPSSRQLVDSYADRDDLEGDEDE